jgi:hypothetical protein
MATVKTTKITGNADYALVPDRLKQFREDNPRGSIRTVMQPQPDGGLIAQTVLIRDKSDEFSAESTGHAYYNTQEMKKPKAFEKLETISVGRALANIGYLNKGQIATTEEMDEFNAYKDERQKDAIQIAVENISKQNSLDKLRVYFTSLGVLIKAPEVVEAKDKRKAELTK